MYAEAHRRLPSFAAPRPHRAARRSRRVWAFGRVGLDGGSRLRTTRHQAAFASGDLAPSRTRCQAGRRPGRARRLRRPRRAAKAAAEAKQKAARQGQAADGQGPKGPPRLGDAGGTTTCSASRSTRPAHLWSHNHSGQDFVVPSGTAVQAAHSGTVVKAGPTAAVTARVRQRDRDQARQRHRTRSTRHLSRIDVHIGQTVRTGQRDRHVRHHRQLDRAAPALRDPHDRRTTAPRSSPLHFLRAHGVNPYAAAPRVNPAVGGHPSGTRARGPGSPDRGRPRGRPCASPRGRLRRPAAANIPACMVNSAVTQRTWSAMAASGSLIRSSSAQHAAA